MMLKQKCQQPSAAPAPGIAGRRVAPVAHAIAAPSIPGKLSPFAGFECVSAYLVSANTAAYTYGCLSVGWRAGKGLRPTL